MKTLSKRSKNKSDKLDLTSYLAITRFGKLHYVAPKKRNSTEVMLFIHGFGSSLTVWTSLAQAARNQGLLKNSDFVMVDLPSFGKSENKLNHLKSVDLGDELLKLCKNLGYSKIRLTGHSMGGFLALDIAARNPQILSVHIIAGTYFRLLRVANHPLKGFLKTPRLAIYYYLQTLISRSEKLTDLTNRLYKIIIGRRKKAIYELSGRSFIYASRNGIGYDPAKEWGSLKIPVKAVFGRRDKLVSTKDMAELQSILPSAEITSLKGAGHSVVISHPNQTARALY